MTNKQTFKTPRGTAMYPWLNKPDTQFDSAGQFKVNLRMKKEDAKDLIDAVKQAAEDAFGSKAKSAKLPFKTDEDTGDIIAVTKSKYQPQVRDSQNNVIPPHRLPDIFGGSELVLGGTMYCYNAGGSIGVSLQLGGVQVIKLAENSSAQGLSFEPVKDGFVANQDSSDGGLEAGYDF